MKRIKGTESLNDEAGHMAKIRRDKFEVSGVRYLIQSLILSCGSFFEGSCLGNQVLKLIFLQCYSMRKKLHPKSSQDSILLLM